MERGEGSPVWWGQIWCSVQSQRVGAGWGPAWSAGPGAGPAGGLGPPGQGVGPGCRPGVGWTWCPAAACRSAWPCSARSGSWGWAARWPVEGGCVRAERRSDKLQAPRRWPGGRPQRGSRGVGGGRANFLTGYGAGAEGRDQSARGPREPPCMRPPPPRMHTRHQENQKSNVQAGPQGRTSGGRQAWGWERVP